MHNALYIPSNVERRIGGLEKPVAFGTLNDIVERRIGGLEIKRVLLLLLLVERRIGGLETNDRRRPRF